MSRRPTIRRLAAGVAAGLLWAGGAFAQSVPPFGLFRGPANVVLGTAVLNNSRNTLDELTAQALAGAIGGSRPAAANAPSVAGPPPTLTYKPDARLSDWTRVRMLDSLNPAADPELQRHIEEAFADNAVLKNFDRFMATRGYSSHDVADDTAELLLVSWQIATSTQPTHSQAQGVHEQTRAVLLNTPQMRTLTDADRQLLAERIAYQVVITSSAHTESLRNGSLTERAQSQDSATAILRSYGVETSKVRLTDEGFHR